MSEPRKQYRRMDRRAFIKHAGGTAVALPSVAAILAACSKPAPKASNGGQGLARLDNPVTLPMKGQPIAATTPLEDATLQIYNWDAYMWKAVLSDWETASSHSYEWSTFNNMSEAESKLSAGQVTPDVFFPTIDILSKSVDQGLLQPLQHDLIPNIAGMWKEFSDPGPFYDVGWRYTVPYAIYTTGIGYNRDKISDEEMAAQGYDIFWNPKYKGKVGIYDDYREAIGMALMRNGVTDVNTADQSLLDKARDDLLELIDLVDIRTSINGAYKGIPEGDYWVHQAWSGDMIGSQWYLPKGVSTDMLGFYLPENFAIGNDTMAIPAVAKSPALAHDFINYFISDEAAFKNFTWNGYQPPLNSLDPSTLVPKYVPETVAAAVVLPEYFKTGHFPVEIDQATDDKWQAVWDEFNAGGK